MGGRFIHVTQKVNGAYPEKKGYVLGSASASAVSYCTNGTWLPTPQCIGSSNVLLQT